MLGPYVKVITLLVNYGKILIEKGQSLKNVGAYINGWIRPLQRAIIPVGCAYIEFFENCLTVWIYLPFI